MLGSGLSSTLLLGAFLLMPAGFTRAELSFPSVVTATSTGRVITFNSVSVQQLSCENGLIIVQSVLHRCEDQNTCSKLPNLDVIKRSCDLKEVCQIQTDIICACNSSICKYLDITYGCFPANRTVACEGSQAKLQCDEGQVIVVYRADYGRRDITTCSDGYSDSQLQNVQCSSPNSTEYVVNSCNWQNNCTVAAKNSVFGDPCGGTAKYLEVVYDCQAASSNTCPPGWSWFGGRCFIFQSSAKSWTDAESSCKTLGGHLASYHSLAEYTFIRDLIYKATGTNTDTWVGGNDLQKKSVWVWSDGSKFDFPHWAPVEPNNSGGNEDCMEINLNGQDYVNDGPCDTQIPFVCVRDP